MTKCSASQTNMIDSPAFPAHVLIFLVSRHMIIGDTSAFEDFVSIVSIALLFAIKKYIQIPPEAGKRKSIFSTCRNEMGDEKSDGEE